MELITILKIDVDAKVDSWLLRDVGGCVDMRMLQVDFDLKLGESAADQLDRRRESFHLDATIIHGL